MPIECTLRRSRHWRKWLARWEFPIYRLFTDTEAPVPAPSLPREPKMRITPKGLQELRAFTKAFSKMDAASISFVMTMASKMARKTPLRE